MGNRAVITTKENYLNNGIGLYLHWNGGKDSVEAFLKYCELKGYRADNCYQWARLSQVISNFLGGTDSIGIQVIEQLDCENEDNGTYLIEGWNIVGRMFMNQPEQDDYDLHTMLLAIDNAQPKEEQIKELIEGIPAKLEDIRIGDTVAFINYDGALVKTKIVGIGEDIMCNGTNVKGLPRTNRLNDCERNINNYLTVRKEGFYRIIEREKEIDDFER